MGKASSMLACAVIPADQRLVGPRPMHRRQVLSCFARAWAPAATVLVPHPLIQPAPAQEWESWVANNVELLCTDESGSQDLVQSIRVCGAAWPPSLSRAGLSASVLGVRPRHRISVLPRPPRLGAGDIQDRDSCGDHHHRSSRHVQQHELGPVGFLGRAGRAGSRQSVRRVFTGEHRFHSRGAWQPCHAMQR